MKLFKMDMSKFLLGLIVFIFLIGIILSVYIFRSNPLEDAISANREINILFIIEDEKMPLSTYVLIYHPITKRAAIFDVPGQIGQRIPRINRVDRIDSVYDPSRVSYYQIEIERLLGININFSVVITKENLVSIVDILEGVEIFIPSPVSYRDDEQLILFPSGITVLDGDKASVYATYSLPYEDYDIQNFRRQRFFLSLLSRQNRMNNAIKDTNVSKMFFSYFKTNMSRRTLRLLFDEFVNIDIGRTNVISVSGDLREVSGQMLILPLRDGNIIKEVVRQTQEALNRDIGDHGERHLTVEVLNGTTITGRASRTAEILRSFGYDVVAVGNADRNDYENTLIIHRLQDAELVNEFGSLIRCTNIRHEFDFLGLNELDLQDTENKAQVTLIIGRDFDGRHVTEN